MALIIIGPASNAQTLNKKFTSNQISKLNKATLSKNYLNDPDYAGKTILLLTPSFPVSFSRLEKDNADQWRIGSQAGIGGAYFFLIGKGYHNIDETIQVEPYLVFWPEH
ncbi:MAG: hypothetical protein IPH04_19750 [Saprospirales bacterium]|nr:hypothetical protein [Saprospirales bacterium]